MSNNLSKKYSIVLATFISLGASMAVQADELQVRKAEEMLKTFEQQNGLQHPGYATKLMIVAMAYQRAGQRSRADATFSRALKLKAKDGTIQELDFLMRWSSVLLEKRNRFDFKPGITEAQKTAVVNKEKELEKQDQVKAMAFLERAKRLSEKLSIDDIYRFGPSMEIIRNSDLTRAKAEEQEVLATVQKHIAGANDSTTIRLAAVYNRLADLHSYGKLRSVEKAIGYMGDYLSLMDKLPAKDPRRIRANRNAVNWYKKVNRQDKAKSQTEKLAKLLGTNDPDKLFPKPKPCLACGRG